MRGFKPANPRDWQRNFEAFEGRVRHLYLDTDGLATIAIGCEVFERGTTLPMRWKINSIRANVDDIGREYDAIRMLPSGKTPAFYDVVARLYLADEDINTLFWQRLNATIQAIEDGIVSLEDYPDTAALVFTDMYFNLGRRLTREFPRFMNAFLSKDWKVAALECKREGVQKERNDWARASLESLISF